MNKDLSYDKSSATFYVYLTEKCNLMCKYCFVASGGRELTLDAFINGYNNFYSLFVHRSRHEICFYGGEPTLKMNLIVEIIELLLRKYPNTYFSFSLTTNGTLLNSESLKVIEKYSIFTCISLDGNKKQHDENRKFINGLGSYDTIIRNIKSVVNLKIPFSLIATISEPEFVKDTYVFLKNLMRIKKFDISEVISPDRFNLNNKEWGIYRAAWLDILNLEIEHFKRDGSWSLIKQKELILRIISRNPIKRFCSAGFESIGLSTNGELYPCYRAYEFDNLRLLNEDIINKEGEFYLASLIDNRKDCMDCWAYKLYTQSTQIF